MNILVTGGSGFLGSNLLNFLQKIPEFRLRTIGRKRPSNISNDDFYKSDINRVSNYNDALKSIDVLIHCAARVHVMDEQIGDSLNEFREVNTNGTLNLARQAADAGVKRFIFISSIKVNGETTGLGTPFTNVDPRNPADAYGQSKSEAEVLLMELAQQSVMEVVIIRPPLVYGPYVKANFGSLIDLVSKGIPLPFGCIKNNRRSLVSVSNLVSLIVTCIEHPNAANQVFLVSDDQDLSTKDMINLLAKSVGKSSFLFPVPVFFCQFIGLLTGQSDVVNRLIGSLQVDIDFTKQTLGWAPPQSVEQGFKEALLARNNNR